MPPCVAPVTLYIKYSAIRRSTAINRRARYSTARNQNLATIASIESNFTGKNKKVAIIGKIHEKGVSFERFMEDIRDYVATEYDEADGSSALKTLANSGPDSIEPTNTRKNTCVIHTS